MWCHMLRKTAITTTFYFPAEEENKKITHMWRRWDMPQNFCLALIDELEKKLFIKKRANKKWANKTFNNHMRYGSWDTEQDRQNFLSFLILISKILTVQPIVTYVSFGFIWNVIIWITLIINTFQGQRILGSTSHVVMKSFHLEH